MQEKHFLFEVPYFIFYILTRAEVQLVVRGQRVTVQGDQQPTGELYGDLWTKVATATHQGFIEG